MCSGIKSYLSYSSRPLSVLLELEAAVLEAEDGAVVAVEEREDLLSLVGVLPGAPI